MSDGVVMGEGELEQVEGCALDGGGEAFCVIQVRC